ncbi:hypothetical protein CYY_001168 [Polysphondylium violaceum]|uniref:cysteine--tRNA ligase n=1 Tax=Polysphondylium violaceum TaxID=133409 RepID=A0A8J4V1V4_9MYCE|nr:hypothetical protein CYY_001168 [Polysphondylium violaceum]
MSETSSPTLESKNKKDKGHPEWHRPSGVETPLMVMNSLTSTKTPFVTKDGKSITWYACGPTVYDASHMGHARTYVSFDIIRRIMKDYLGYNIKFVMNITDIDDKIIIRAREQGISHSDLSKKWEAAFFEDMKCLNVLPPDALTRVTEYVPQIVKYVEKIIENGYAYESKGSVYFDTVAYSKVHDYGKLEPKSVGNEKLTSEGEGSLSTGTEKRNACDFALWKKSKEGEPVWQSPWGEGRPGWHIECSAMASDILGSNIDIHSGGEDLKFPHHDNELAQSEAHYGCNQWINYFIHSGHLLIDGLKMSKSLKNFITIQQALEKYTPRQMRMFFLLHRYDKPMNYSPESMTYAIDIEKTFSEFFHIVKQNNREFPQNLPQFWEDSEKALYQDLQSVKKQVFDLLMDNFNTPDVITLLTDLVKKTNTYFNQCKETAKNPRLSLSISVADYITHILNVFGLIESAQIGFSSGSGNIEEALTPILDALTNFRSQVRQMAIAKETGNILNVCDSLRDEILPLLGIKIDDKGATGSVKKAEKEERARKEKEKLEKAKIPPSELFKNETDKYSLFDERGVPTHDKEGKEITKSQLKKLVSAYDAQAKAHKQYLDSLVVKQE